MLKKLLSISLCICLVLCLAACGGEAPIDDSTPTDGGTTDITPEPQPEPKPTKLVNPLTGLEDLPLDKGNVRPLAIMIDNDSLAQNNSQIGVPSADIIFETEVEGGICRLVALFANGEGAPQIGNVRSARVVYIDIATGFNAIYCHHGIDAVYAVNRLKELGTDNFVLGENNGGWRQTYGKPASWQNLYTTGEKLWASLEKKGWKTTQDKFEPWQTFTNEEVSLTSGIANKLSVKYNGNSHSYFTYDPANKEYLKTSRHSQNKDNLTGDAYAFKNVIVIQTTMGYYTTDPHRKIDLTSGSGYYMVNGTYQEIKWEKGAATNNFKFTTADGKPLTMQAGKTWVCIANVKSTILFE